MEIKRYLLATYRNKEFIYAQYDDYSTGYPVFSDISKAIRFTSVEEVEKWFYENKRELRLFYNENEYNTFYIIEEKYEYVKKFIS